MRLRHLAASTAHRFRVPATWGAILVFGLVWVLVRLAGGQPFGRMGLGEFTLPALALAGHMALSPLPWQWTGNDRPMAALWRGCLQALPWNALWLAGLLALTHGLFPEDHPRRPEPSRPAAEEQAEAPRPPRPEDGEATRLERPRREAQEDRRPPRVDGDAPPRRERRQDPRDEQPEPRPGLFAHLLPDHRGALMVFLLNLPFAMVLGWFMADKERAEQAEARLQEQARQARALTLQSQLHPHALYNLLGGITELVHEDPDAAEEALVGLVDLLRMLSRNATAAEVPLAQERALLKRYLAIEAIRLGSRLQVAWDWPDWADALLLPPLLLQPLVENAVKHGLAPCPEGGRLRIAAHRSGSDLVLRVGNTGQPLQQDGGGLGLDNLRERLLLNPALKATLDLRSEDGWTLAELRLRDRLAP